VTSRYDASCKRISAYSDRLRNNAMIQEVFANTGYGPCGDRVPKSMEKSRTFWTERMLKLGKVGLPSCAEARLT
jgi:hypothetical protein